MIVNHVRSHADEREPALSLANDFMTCGERNQMSETFKRDNVAVVDVLPDCFA